MVWAFILGLLVGQGSLGNDQQLASLRRLSLSWFGLSSQGPELPERPPLRDPDLTFYDELGVKRPQPAPGSEANPEESAPVPPNSQISPSPSPPDSPPVRESQTPAQRRPLNQVRPYDPNAPVNPASPGPARSAAPVTRGENASAGRFTIQAGSFRDENQASQLAARLVRRGFPAYVSRAQLEGAGTRFRVRVGGYDNLDQAQNVATSLRARENISAYVTRNE